MGAELVVGIDGRHFNRKKKLRNNLEPSTYPFLAKTFLRVAKCLEVKWYLSNTSWMCRSRRLWLRPILPMIYSIWDLVESASTMVSILDRSKPTEEYL